MAYMRGDYYLWSDGESIHLWASDGYDGWDESGWHHQDDGDQYPVEPTHLKDGVNNASGVGIHQEVMDEYVMMRLAQMLHEGLVDAAIDRCTDPAGRGGNIGGMMLRTNADALKQALSGLKMRPAMPSERERLTSKLDPENNRNTHA